MTAMKNKQKKPALFCMYIFIFLYSLRWRRQWHPTPVLLPGESQGQRSLVGCRLWGRTESDTTEVTDVAFLEQLLS